MREWWPILPQKGNSDYAPSLWIRAEVPLVFLAYAIGDFSQCFRTFGPFSCGYLRDYSTPRVMHNDENMMMKRRW